MKARSLQIQKYHKIAQLPEQNKFKKGKNIIENIIQKQNTKLNTKLSTKLSTKYSTKIQY